MFIISLLIQISFNKSTDKSLQKNLLSNPDSHIVMELSPVSSNILKDEEDSEDKIIDTNKKKFVLKKEDEDDISSSVSEEDKELGNHEVIIFHQEPNEGVQVPPNIDILDRIKHGEKITFNEYETFLQNFAQSHYINVSEPLDIVCQTSIIDSPIFTSPLPGISAFKNVDINSIAFGQYGHDGVVFVKPGGMPQFVWTKLLLDSEDKDDPNFFIMTYLLNYHLESALTTEYIDDLNYDVDSADSLVLAVMRDIALIPEIFDDFTIDARDYSQAVLDRYNIYDVIDALSIADRVYLGLTDDDNTLLQTPADVANAKLFLYRVEDYSKSWFMGKCKCCGCYPFALTCAFCSNVDQCCWRCRAELRRR